MRSNPRQPRTAGNGGAAEAEGAKTAADWWLRGWLLDARRTARWDACPRPLHRAADALARRYNGRVVRLRRLPDGFGASERDPSGRPVPLDPEPFGIESILTEGWPGGPRPPAGAWLIAPVEFLLGALRRESVGAGEPEGGRGP